MRAIVQHRYGPPDKLQVRDVTRPAIGATGVLVRVHAAGLHIGDCFGVRGRPLPMRLASGLLRPKNGVPGSDIAGRVEAVGADVTTFEVGNEVFGAGQGACAEYARAGENQLARKPTNLTFEEAAAAPTSGVAALHGLRDAGRLRPGQKVLINGASGGPGSALQRRATRGGERRLDRGGGGQRRKPAATSGQGQRSRRPGGTVAAQRTGQYGRTGDAVGRRVRRPVRVRLGTVAAMDDSLDNKPKLTRGQVSSGLDDAPRHGRGSTGLLRVIGRNRHPVRRRGLRERHVDLQDAVAVARAHVARLDAGGKCDGAGHAAVAEFALLAVVLGLLALGRW
jgi:hypothetical protein